MKYLYVLLVGIVLSGCSLAPTQHEGVLLPQGTLIKNVARNDIDKYYCSSGVVYARTGLGPASGYLLSCE